MHGVLHITHDCNLRCTYCYTGRKFYKVMSLETGRRAIDFLFQHTDRRHGLMITFFGGEPLLEFDRMVRLTEYALAQAQERMIPIYFMAVTNGTILDSEILAFWRRYHYKVRLSLDGGPDAQNTERLTPGGQGSWSLVERNLDDLLVYDPFIDVQMVMTPRNIRHLADSVGTLYERGFRNFNNALNVLARWTDEPFAHLEEQYERIADLYVGSYRRDDPLWFKGLDGRMPSRGACADNPLLRCGFGEREVSISVDGHLYPCVRFVQENQNETARIGHVASGFDEVRRQAFIFAGQAPEYTACLSCPHPYRCYNWCGCENYSATGDVNTPSPETCRHEKIAIRLADRTADVLLAERNPLFLRRYPGLARAAEPLLAAGIAV